MCLVTELASTLYCNEGVVVKATQKSPVHSVLMVKFSPVHLKSLLRVSAMHGRITRVITDIIGKGRAPMGKGGTPKDGIFVGGRFQNGPE